MMRGTEINPFKEKKISHGPSIANLPGIVGGFGNYAYEKHFYLEADIFDTL